MTPLAAAVRSIEDDIADAPDSVSVAPALHVYQRIRSWLALADDPAATPVDRAVARSKALDLIAVVLSARESARGSA
jgi:hypothetical protein